MLNRLKQYSSDTFHSLKVRNYRLYFTGQAISMCGTWMQRIGQSWLVLSLTGSGTAVGMVVAFQYLPILIFGPVGGVIADHFPKRKVLFFTQSIAGLLALILGILVATQSAEIWMVYVLASCLGFVDVVDSPTRQTFIHEMVGSDKIKNAVTLNSIQANVGKMLGPAIAGIVIATAGIATCFFLNSVTFIAVLICLSMMKHQELNISEKTVETGGRLISGLRYIRQTPMILNMLIMSAVVGMLTYEFQVSLSLIAKFTFHGDAKSFAILMSAMGAGSIIAGLIIASRKNENPIAFSWACLLFGLAVIGASLSPTLSVAALFMALAGAASIAFSSTGNTTIQLASRPDMRGRVMALWAVAFLGTTPIGGPIIGWIGEHTNPRGALLTGGVAALLVGLYGLILFSQHKMREDNAAAVVDTQRPPSPV